MSVEVTKVTASTTSPNRRTPLRLLLLAIPTLMLIGTAAVSADSLIPRGEPAPALAAPMLRGGEIVRLADYRGKVVLLLFGELYNENSVAACKDIAAVLAAPAMSDASAAAFMIVTQKAPVSELLADAERKGVTLPILHDVGRAAFADYHVMVLPSLVIVGADGATVLPCAGYPLGFQDMLADAISFAAGRISQVEYERQRAAETERAAAGPQVKARRLAALGEQLARRGSVELAITSFQEALTLDADCTAARIGFGNCLLNQNKLVEAETHFLRALETTPESVDAALGLARIQAHRGGDELKAAGERLRELLRQNPNDPRVLYLAGLVAEKSGDADAALGHYKRAAELLMYGQRSRLEMK